MTIVLGIIVGICLVAGALIRSVEKSLNAAGEGLDALLKGLFYRVPELIVMVYAFFGVELVAAYFGHADSWLIKIVVAIVVAWIFFVTEDGSVYVLAATVALAIAFLLSKYTDVKDILIWIISGVVLFITWRIMRHLLYLNRDNDCVRFALCECGGFYAYVTYILSTAVFLHGIHYFIG